MYYIIGMRYYFFIMTYFITVLSFVFSVINLTIFFLVIISKLVSGSSNINIVLFSFNIPLIIIIIFCIPRDILEPFTPVFDIILYQLN